MTHHNYTREEGRVPLFSTTGTGAARQRAAENQSHICHVPGCSERRTGFANYCQTHISYKNRFGSPTGRRVRPEEYAATVTEAAAMIAANPEHVGIQSAVLRIESLMAQHCHGTSKEKVDEQFRQLRTHGVTALDILTTVAGIRLFIKRNPRTCPDDRAEDFLASIAVSRLAPRPRINGYPTRVQYSFLSYAGVTLRQALGSLLLNLVDACEAKAQAAAKAKHDAEMAAFAPLNL